LFWEEVLGQQGEEEQVAELPLVGLEGLLEEVVVVVEAALRCLLESHY
jgi:hypothetical protein